jgi:hypothetical protein
MAGVQAAAAARRPAHHRHSKGIPAIEAGLSPSSLVAPISREVLEPGASGSLVILGGLTAGGTSADGVYSLDPIGGAITLTGTLPAGVHDAAGSVIGGRDVVFGGGSPSTVGTVESISTTGTGTNTGTVISNLPTPRSDADAVSIKGTTYIVGGYDGTAPDAAVLATTNGRTFSTVARLKVPVRYPAVAAHGNEIYVFGGEAVAGSGGPVSTIQMIDPARHSVSIVGHLPEPLQGAVAVSLKGTIYLAGGSSSIVQPATPGLGVTAVAPPVTGVLATVSTIWAYDPVSRRLLVAGRLQEPVSNAGAAVVGSRAWIVGGELNGTPVAAVQMFEENIAFGTAGAPGAGSPYFGGKLLIADRGSNRLMLLNPSMKILWTYPSATSPPNPDGFYFPDDAFFIDKGRAIITNQEQNETIEEIAYPSGKVLWTYGHPGTAGSAPGYLHEPDDAYLWKNGQVSVADADNCRVLVLNHNGTVAHQIGTTGSCVHNPPTSLGTPNGDTPLANGNLLISEINGSWVSEYTMTGQLVWTLQLPISYPSDPQQLGPDLYLISDYSNPGQILEFTRQGTITWRYDVTSGPGALDQPSLAERLPSGVILLNDDYNDRLVAIDPATDALVWQYGVTGQSGTVPGMLNTPDGFDVLMPGGLTPTHPTTG